jgi:hypothetical protein
MCVLPALAANETFEDVSLIDSNCSKKAAADPDSHTRECALKCQAGGYGILTSDKKFIKFDAAGNSKITDALKASDQKDHLRVGVSGEVKGDTLEGVGWALRTEDWKLIPFAGSSFLPLCKSFCRYCIVAANLAYDGVC